MIIECSCINRYQDKRYGKNKRVCNILKRVMSNEDKYRCVVCLKEHGCKSN